MSIPDANTAGDPTANLNGERKSHMLITPRLLLVPLVLAGATVTTKNEFKGSISGVETGDMVHLGSNNSANVSTSGGNVSTGNMYMGTISYAGPPNMASTRIEPPAGEPFLLAPGSSVTYPAP